MSSVGRLICVVTFVTGTAAAQDSLVARYEAAVAAWGDGDYITALELLERVLAHPDGARFTRSAALLTGEWYRTVEVAPDGRSVRWSSDGRLASYEVGDGAEILTQIVRIAGTEIVPVAAVRGRGVSLRPDGGAVAFRRLREGEDLERARREVRAGVQIRSLEDVRRLQRDLALVEARFSQLVVQNLPGGEERPVDVGALAPLEATWGPDNRLYFSAWSASDSTRSEVYRVTSDGGIARVTNAPGFKYDLRVYSDRIVFLTADGVGVARLPEGAVHLMPAQAPAFSADGRTMAFLASAGDQTAVSVAALEPGSDPRAIFRTPVPIQNLAVAPDGSQVAFQLMPREDWEIYVVGVDGSGGRLTYDVQHDLFPQFLPPGDGRTRPRYAVFAVIGEARHRRSYLYDLATGERIRLFHNNTVRTVAPEYEWAVSPEGDAILIVAERDGDTISPERGVYLVRLDQTVTQEEVLERIRENLARERRLVEQGQKLFAPIADNVRAAVADVSVTRIYGYAEQLYRIGSKYITQPGNGRAIEYLERTLRSFGYEPELQWFEPRPGVRTANVVATLRGTVHPDLVYVVSSHFDSVERGPGADDNSSGTSALLEAARVMAQRPMPATIRFAFFTGEEAGLLGSREFVRRAVAAGERIVGALNNDMLGYANDGRLDNTIRYSNAGIRDLQHAAAFLFTRLITYDAKYYKSTDAHAYYEAYGDIVGGIGSYPILGNPHYHQSHDVLETINHQIVAEVAKTTVASLMLLASSPARLTEVEAETIAPGRVRVRWQPAPERDVREYLVRYTPKGGGGEREIVVREPQVELRDVAGGSPIAVKAVNRAGLAGWDWARVVPSS